MEKAGENQQREAKGCSEASQEGKSTNRWVTGLLNVKFTLILFLFYSKKLIAHCLHAGQLLVELLRNGIRTMSRMSSFCVHLLHHIWDESIPHKHFFAVEIEGGERERQGFQLIFSISFPMSPLCSSPFQSSCLCWHEKVSRCCPGCGDPWIPSVHHINKHLTHLNLCILRTAQNCPKLNLLHRSCKNSHFWEWQTGVRIHLQRNKSPSLSNMLISLLPTKISRTLIYR